MDVFIYAVVAVVIVFLALFALDRHLCLKDAEADIKIYHADVLDARDLITDPAIKVHYQAVASALRTIIRNNFKE